ncbi:hypothetical protein ACU635_18780 [[Actinomadura] parvosata]
MKAADLLFPVTIQKRQLNLLDAFRPVARENARMNLVSDGPGGDG